MFEKFSQKRAASAGHIALPPILPMFHFAPTPLPPTTTRDAESAPETEILPPVAKPGIPKVLQNLMSSTFNSEENILKSSSCPLYLICYRTGTTGPEIRAIQAAKQLHHKQCGSAKGGASGSIAVLGDRELFQAVHDVYLYEMCSIWRRAFSLKTLRGIRLLYFTPTTRPAIVPLDEFVLQEVLYACKNPEKVNSGTEWIDWVFSLRQVECRHALEFIEGWNGSRVAVAGSIPLVISTFVGIIWSFKTGEIQDAFAVAGFILTAGSLLLALLAVISGIESSSGIQRRSVT
ncbi:hypothetical protein BJ878DRAFT_504823 [Calycina marina]|uniref:Uncharacterized protein n=1 Tax=Calycina marina TaxID=1763456 RepID=A0A9P8CF34_9HELO|nr:hypothetical protein BJ878DRAFT_504823 [Calycina marina]